MAFNIPCRGCYSKKNESIDFAYQFMMILPEDDGI